MIQLSIESSTRVASICLLKDDQVIEERSLGHEKPATVRLLPEIKMILGNAKLTPRHVDAVSISVGPGSFTGLRLGVATAKSFAYSANCQLFAVETHKVIGRQAIQDAGIAFQDFGQVAIVIDAQRGQWFAERHLLDENGLSTIATSSIVDPSEFVMALSMPTLITGPGLQRFEHKIDWPEHTHLVNRQLWIPAARTLGLLVASSDVAVKSTSPFSLSPVYGRRSAAEEKLHD